MPTPAHTLHLDVENLERSIAFYDRVFGYKPVGTDRAGMIFESRTLVSERYPHLGLILRAAFGKRVSATQPGTVTSIGFAVASVPQMVKDLTGIVRWAGQPPAADATSAKFIDPDAYMIEVYEARR